jgi:hypothetical protein
MNEVERVRIQSCGCQYDAPTGLTTLFCKRHDPEYANWLVWFPRDDDYFRVVEKSENGQVTIWDSTRFGAVGQIGTPKPEAKLKSITTAKERKEVDRVKAMIGRAVEQSQRTYELMKAVQS